MRATTTNVNEGDVIEWNGVSHSFRAKVVRSASGELRAELDNGRVFPLVEICRVFSFKVVKP